MLAGRLSAKRAVVLALIAVATSCRPDNGSEDERRVEVTDSAGIRVIQNHGPTLELPVRESTRFGLVDGDPNLLFNAIRAMAVAPDGSLWVSDSHESVRHYTVQGSYLGSAGGTGDGPGESLRGYGDIWATDSTVYAAASSQGTFQLFDSDDGDFIGARPVYSDDGSALVVVGASVEGWYFLNVGFPPPDQLRGRGQWTLYRGSPTAPGLDLGGRV